MKELTREDLIQASRVLGGPFSRKLFDKEDANTFFRMKNPADPSGNMWTERKVYYDTYSVAVATTVVGQVATMFQRQVGGSITLANTNMEDTGRIANLNLFTCMAFGCFFTGNSLGADLVNVQELMTVKLRVQDVYYAKGKVVMFPGGRGITGGGAALPAAVGTLAQITSFSNGVAHIENMHKFIKGIDLLQGQSIAVELVAEGSGFSTASAANGGSGFTLTVVLDGYERRRTQ